MCMDLEGQLWNKCDALSLRPRHNFCLQGLCKSRDPESHLALAHAGLPMTLCWIVAAWGRDITCWLVLLFVGGAFSTSSLNTDGKRKRESGEEGRGPTVQPGQGPGAPGRQRGYQVN